MIRLELQKLLDDRNMKQRELSRLSGVRQARIGQICKGYVDRLELDHVDAICNVLDVSPCDWIVWDKDE